MENLQLKRKYENCICRTELPCVLQLKKKILSHTICGKEKSGQYLYIEVSKIMFQKNSVSQKPIRTVPKERGTR